MPGTLSNVPGAETEVFFPGEKGLLWTDVIVSGTLDNPREDLTQRLIAAAGMRMFELLPETGELALKYSGRVLDGEFADLISENGDEVIRQGKALLEQGKALIDKDGKLSEEAEELLRQGEDAVRGLGGLLDSLRSRE